jgi:hypothetical protein
MADVVRGAEVQDADRRQRDAEHAHGLGDSDDGRVVCPDPPSTRRCPSTRAAAKYAGAGDVAIATSAIGILQSRRRRSWWGARDQVKGVRNDASQIGFQPGEHVRREQCLSSAPVERQDLESLGPQRSADRISHIYPRRLQCATAKVCSARPDRNYIDVTSLCPGTDINRPRAISPAAGRHGEGSIPARTRSRRPSATA